MLAMVNEIQNKVLGSTHGCNDIAVCQLNAFGITSGAWSNSFTPSVNLNHNTGIVPTYEYMIMARSSAFGAELSMSLELIFVSRISGQWCTCMSL